MSEKQHSNEHLPQQPSPELIRDIGKRPETQPQLTPEHPQARIEHAREVIERQAEQPPAKTEHEDVPRPQFNRKAAYTETMQSLHRRLKPTSRQFSNFIHQPSIEKTSEALGKTVFRPSVTLGATVTAFIIGAFLYITARWYGFTLSGSEFWVAMLVGGVLGLVIEMALKPFHRR